MFQKQSNGERKKKKSIFFMKKFGEMKESFKFAPAITHWSMV